MTIGRIINSDCVIQKRKNPLTRGDGDMPVQLNSNQLTSGFILIHKNEFRKIVCCREQKNEAVKFLQHRYLLFKTRNLFWIQRNKGKDLFDEILNDRAK